MQKNTASFMIRLKKIILLNMLNRPILFFFITFTVMSFSISRVISQEQEDKLVAGIHYFTIGLYDNARVSFMEFHEAHPNDPVCLFYLGRLERDALKSQEFYDTLLNNHPQHKLADDALFEIADKFFAEGWYYMAKAKFQALLDDYPSSELTRLALYKIGLTEMSLENYEKAREIFSKYVDIHQGSDLVHFARTGIVDSYFAESDFEKARKEATSLLESESELPLESHILEVFAKSCRALGDTVGAGAAERMIIEEHPLSYAAAVLGSGLVVYTDNEKFFPDTLWDNTLSLEDSTAVPGKTDSLTAGETAEPEQKLFTIQAIAANSKIYAFTMFSKLKKAGFDVRMILSNKEGDIPYRVRVGYYPTREKAIRDGKYITKITGDGVYIVDLKKFPE